MTNRTDKTRLIPPHGGYRKLKSYQMAEIVTDLTPIFCERFLEGTPRTNRTHDQMIQGSRSGCSNLAEASQDSGTSKKMEIKLVGVARGSLEELLNDYLAFLRRKNLALWEKNDKRALKIRELSYMPYRSYMTYTPYLNNPESAANCMICLIHQANYLIDQQLRALEKDFLEKGGFTERLYQTRKEILEQRRKQLNP